MQVDASLQYASFGDRLLNGLTMALIGMTITIGTLVALSFIIKFGSAAIASRRNKAAGGSGGASGAGAAAPGGGSGGAGAGTGAGVAQATAAVAAAAAASPAGTAPATDDGALVAALTAAVMAFTGGARNLRVVSFRKTGQTAPAWNLRGRSEYLSGKL